MRLAVWHKQELPEEAIEKIKVAINDVLGKSELPGQWTLDQAEFENLVKGFVQCLTIPAEIENGLIEIIKQYKKKQAEEKISGENIN